MISRQRPTSHIREIVCVIARPDLHCNFDCKPLARARLAQAVLFRYNANAERLADREDEQLTEVTLFSSAIINVLHSNDHGHSLTWSRV